MRICQEIPHNMTSWALFPSFLGTLKVSRLGRYNYYKLVCGNAPQLQTSQVCHQNTSSSLYLSLRNCHAGRNTYFTMIEGPKERRPESSDFYDSIRHLPYLFRPPFLVPRTCPVETHIPFVMLEKTRSCEVLVYGFADGLADLERYLTRRRVR